MHPFRAARLAEQAQRFSAAELARACREAVAAHRGLVSSAVPPALGLELLLIRILGVPGGAVREGRASAA
jgi:hypothetical protein